MQARNTPYHLYRVSIARAAIKQHGREAALYIVLVELATNSTT